MPRPELPIDADVTVTGIDGETAEQIRQCFMTGIEHAVAELTEARKIDLTTTEVANAYASTLGRGKATVTINLWANIPEESLKTIARCANVHALGGMLQLGMHELVDYLVEYGRNVLVGLGATLTDLGSNLLSRFGGK